ncbi:hypothetical protein HK100_000165 [Physocladia obscura]|uniref:Uncharacterized protein n=1 Tax=Physocladia obscura TaxID=109957 RepID=A0AAD5XFT1_9FUNG|nr:hypothetical protein HK100_000165 [Physocladia obscura]
MKKNFKRFQHQLVGEFSEKLRITANEANLDEKINFGELGAKRKFAVLSENETTRSSNVNYNSRNSQRVPQAQSHISSSNELTANKNFTIEWYSAILSLSVFINGSKQENHVIASGIYLENLCAVLEHQVDLFPGNFPVRCCPPNPPPSIADGIFQTKKDLGDINAIIGERKNAQALYLLQECQVYVGEYKVWEAEFQAPKKEWTQCAETVSIGYAIISKVLARIDDWIVSATNQFPNYDDYLDDSDDNTIIHDVTQLHLFIIPIDHSCSHAALVKTQILHTCAKRISQLEAKLASQIYDRNRVRDKIGIDQWKSNLAPKMP